MKLKLFFLIGRHLYLKSDLDKFCWLNVCLISVMNLIEKKLRLAHLCHYSLLYWIKRMSMCSDHLKSVQMAAVVGPRSYKIC